MVSLKPLLIFLSGIKKSFPRVQDLVQALKEVDLYLDEDEVLDLGGEELKIYYPEE